MTTEPSTGVSANDADQVTGGAFGKKAIGWASFEWARNPYYNIIVIFIFTPYFANAVINSGELGQTLVGVAIAIAGVIMAIVSPILGSIVDNAGPKKPFIFYTFGVLALCALLLGFVTPDLPGAIPIGMFLLIVGYCSYTISELLHNAMLPGAGDSKALPLVSGLGLAMGNGAGMVLLIAVAVVSTVQPFGLKIPTKAEILDWIASNPTLNSKRDIAKAFGIKGAARIDLKRLLKELEAEGHLEKRRRSYRDPDRLPPVSVLQVNAPDSDGDLFAKPLEWHGEGVEPVVLIIPRASDPALGQGDRILARLTLVQGEEYHYEARLIRRIGTNPKRILGVFRKTSEGGRIVPVDKSSSAEWQVAEGETKSAQDGELVEAEQSGPKGRLGLTKARIVARLGDPSAPKAVSLIAIHQHGIPDHFPGEVVKEADKTKPVALGNRTDLRDMPLVTIDPADARDHDDAIWAAPNKDGGYDAVVAIADVSFSSRY